MRVKSEGNAQLTDMSVKLDGLQVSLVDASTAISGSNQPVLDRLSGLEGRLDLLSGELAAASRFSDSQQQSSSATSERIEGFAVLLSEIKTQVHEESSKTESTSAEYYGMIAGLEAKIEALQGSFDNIEIP